MRNRKPQVFSKRKPPAGNRKSQEFSIREVPIMDRKSHNICRVRQTEKLKKVKKSADFITKSALLVVAGEGFEPTTSGL